MICSCKPSADKLRAVSAGTELIPALLSRKSILADSPRVLVTCLEKSKMEVWEEVSQVRMWRFLEERD